MKIYLISLGCAKNRVDSELIIGLLEKNKAVLVDEPNEADLLMVNTCAFIESARKEAIDTILSLADYKTGNKKLVVCGCLPQRYDNLAQLLPEVDAFIPIKDYSNFSKIINNLYKSDYQGELSFLNKHISTPNYMRYIKISEGCLNHCAFCAIPLIRGKLKSRTIDDIVNEVSQAVKDGAYEINLISQDTTRYGYDIYKENSIVNLLAEIVKIPGDFKVRLLYLYPDIVNDLLIQFIKNNSKIMPYFDIPIQHSEDSLLKAMNRRGNKEYLLDLFRKIKKEIPNAIIRTTLIVGFPGETDLDIDNLIEFIEEVKFDRLGAFTYSKEEGTKGAKMPNQIKERIKKIRYNKVMQIQENIARKKQEKYINTIIDDCFITGYDAENLMYLARNYMYAPDDIDGVIYVAAKDEHKLGDLVKIKIKNADAYSLVGEEI